MKPLLSVSRGFRAQLWPCGSVQPYENRWVAGCSCVENRVGHTHRGTHRSMKNIPLHLPSSLSTSRSGSTLTFCAWSWPCASSRPGLRLGMSPCQAPNLHEEATLSFFPQISLRFLTRTKLSVGTGRMKLEGPATCRGRSPWTLLPGRSPGLCIRLFLQPFRPLLD